MERSSARNRDVVAARPERVDREMAAARRLLECRTSEIEEVLGVVADRLAEEVRAERSRSSAVEETVPAATPPAQPA